MKTITRNEHGYYETRVKGTDGKMHSISTGQKDKAKAKEVIKAARIEELERIAETGLLTPNVLSVLLAGKKMKVPDAMPAWEEWMRYDHQSENSIASARMWVHCWIESNWMRDRPLMSVTREDIDCWLNHPRLKSKASTRRVMLASVRSFFKFCSANGWTAGNPAALLRIDYSALSHKQKEIEPKPIFEDSEVQALLDLTAPAGDKPMPFWHAAIAIGRWTGLRMSDIACLEWDCFSIPDKLCVWTMKRDKRVELDLEPAQLREAVTSIVSSDPVYLFPKERAAVLSTKTRSALSIAFIRLCRKAGIEGKSFHGLRSTCASRLHEAGVNREKIKEILGHSNQETTDGYIREEEL